MEVTEELRKEIGKRVRYIRGDRTQEDFAALIGVTRANLASVETGRSFPGPVFLVNLAHVCNISLDWLLLGKSSAGARFGGQGVLLEVTPDDDEELAELLAQLWEFARDADEETRVWMRVQLKRAFPELATTAADTKKQHSAAFESA